MKTFFLLALIVSFSIALWAADGLPRLNVKEGLWEMTTTRSMTGMPPIPADSLAKMTPEQRAKVEAMMSQNGMGAPATNVRKECVTKEKLDKQSAFAEDRKDKKCTRTVVNSTGRKMEVKIHCEGNQNDGDGTMVLEVIDADTVKGTVQFGSNGNGRAMTVNMTFTGRYLGSDCGDVK